MLRRLKLEEGWTTLILLWLLIAVAASAIIAAEYTDEIIQVLLPVGTIAVLAGLALAKSNFSSQRAHLFSLVYGIAVVSFLVGHTLPGFDLTWRLRILELFDRQAVWVQQALDGRASRDSLIFVLQTSGVFWLLGYTASWYTFRKPRVWRVVIPTGLVLLSVVYYYNGPKPLVIFLTVYALVALLFFARTYLVDQERGWRAAAVRYEDGIRFDFLRAAFVIGALSLLLATTLPALGANNEVTGALATVDRPWRKFQDTWTRLFASLNSYGRATNDAYQDTMVLGGPRNPGNRLIMDIYVPEPLPSIYWQGVVLDAYDGRGGWSNTTETTLLSLPSEGRLKQPELLAREPLTQTVVNYTPNSGTLYASSQFIATDRQTFIDVDAVFNGEVRAINWIRSRYVLRPGDSYTVISYVSTADKTSLRSAGTSYPGWVSERYLDVPETITPETRALAAELAAPYDNSFDKAIAIRDYLRANIAYNDQIQAPPPDVEPVHYILFDGQEAYCTYYASAMAMMLRSEGIPARIVNGYAQGEYQEETSSYRVRSNNAHTWVEVFFPRYGWIIFEPTASIPVVELPEGDGGNPGDAFGAAAPLPDPDRPLLDDDVLSGPDLDGLAAELAAEDAAAQAERRRLLVTRALSGSALLLVAGVMVFTANQYNQRVEGDVDRSYDRLATWARWLGILFRPADTPYERADELSRAVPDGREPIRNLTHEYVLRRFSRARQGAAEFDPRSEWKRLRPLLLRRSLREVWQQLRRR
ncbi:MAG: transglutaminase domain-containing protein [Anaerolineae bacterium]|nr:transglutaminase domain-containing protein [Anaerolineae bacterium]